MRQEVIDKIVGRAQNIFEEHNEEKILARLLGNIEKLFEFDMFEHGEELRTEFKVIGVKLFVDMEKISQVFLYSTISKTYVVKGQYRNCLDLTKSQRDVFKSIFDVDMTGKLYYELIKFIQSYLKDYFSVEEDPFTSSDGALTIKIKDN